MQKIPKPFSVQIKIKMSTDKTFKRVLQGLGSINKSTMISMVKFAMARSFQKAIAERYAKVASTITKTEQISRTRAQNTNFQNQNKRRQLISVATKLQQAIAAGNEKSIKRLQEQQRKLIQQYTKLQSSLDRKPKGILKSHLQRAINVATARRVTAHSRMIRRFTDNSSMKGFSIESGVVVNIGNMAEINQIDVPSITTILNRGASARSKFRNLLKLMEYGSGLYAKPSPVLHRSRYKTEVGTWFYGPRKGQGLHFAGQKPGNFLRTQTGLRYTQDGLMFMQIFANRLNNRIFGI